MSRGIFESITGRAMPVSSAPKFAKQLLPLECTRRNRSRDQHRDLLVVDGLCVTSIRKIFLENLLKAGKIEELPRCSYAIIRGQGSGVGERRREGMMRKEA